MKLAYSGLVTAFSLLATLAGSFDARALPPLAVNHVKGSAVQVRVRFGHEQSTSPLDGRILVILSRDFAEESRFQINDSPRTQQIFGIDVEGLKPGQNAVLDATTLGYPLASLANVPAGAYRVQALLHRYETFHRADGHTVRLPMDRGEGMQWNKAPGNRFSLPREVKLDPREPAPISLVLDQIIPPIPPPATTKYVKHETIQTRRAPTPSPASAITRCTPPRLSNGSSSPPRRGRI